jgi:hypothetical protein
MNAQSIAKEVAKQLRNLDSIAEAKVDAEYSDDVNAIVEVKTQGAHYYDITIERMAPENKGAKEGS